MGFGNKPCEHDRKWIRVSAHLEKCSGCGTLRHRAFVPRDGGQARSATHTKVT